MLGFHSLLEGLALGSVSQGAAQEALALAILFHKATDTFALAVTLGRYGFSAGKIVLATLILSLASPGGAWLAAEVNLGGWEVLHGILSAATCGTFLYLAGFDLLVPELREREGRLWKGLAAGLGFALVGYAAWSGRCC
jgi:zinc transporter ZupT